MREVVIPGENLSQTDGTRVGKGSFKNETGVHASCMGLLEMRNDFANVVPLNGKYIPRSRDVIIGIVKFVKFNAAFVDLNSPYSGYLSMMHDSYKVGDIVQAEVVGVDEVKKVDLDYARKLTNGKVIEVISVKVPRIVGKKGSMLQVLKRSGAQITVGNNGRIFLEGTPDAIIKAESAIRVIEKEAHKSGLTNRMEALMGPSRLEEARRKTEEAKEKAKENKRK